MELNILSAAMSKPTLLVMLAIVLLIGVTGWLTWDRAVPAVVLPRPDERARVLGDTFPKTLIDAYGQKTILPRPPRRIVSAMLATDEMLIDLVPTKRIAAVTFLASLPTESNCADRVQSVFALPGLKVEPVVALQPDLVLASRLSDGNVIAQLRQCGVPVFCFGHFDSLAEIRANVLLLGQVLGAETKAKRLAAWMDHTLSEVQQRTKDVRARPTVLYYSQNFTAGRQTIFDELTRHAGATNLAAEAGITGHRMLSTEMLLALDPDVLILPSPNPKLTMPPWNTLRAVRTGRVHVLPGKHLNCISHHVVQAAVDLGQVLHPRRVPATLGRFRVPGM